MADSITASAGRQTLLPFLASSPPIHPAANAALSRSCLPPSNHVDTSQRAATAIVMIAPTIRGEVYRLIVRAGSAGMTNEELARATLRKESTVSARVNELHDKLRLIVDSGRRRATSSGRDAIVWVAVNANIEGKTGDDRRTAAN